MRSRAVLLAVAPLVGAVLVASSGGAAAMTTLWPTYHLDPGRSGNDTGEPSFSNLHSAWNSAALDGAIYAEPLIDGNLVIVATENNSLYAFNATTGSLQWGPINPFGPARTTFPFPCGNIMPLGITGTPVIDGGFLYAVGDVQITSTTFQWHLAKVDPGTGAVSYTTDITPPPGGSSTMDTNLQQERTALSVSNGNIVVEWGALSEDCGDYHGFVVTASEATGAVQAQWNDTFESSTSVGGGIWSTSGAAVDSSGNIYVSTGNGSSSDITAYTGDYGDSVLKLSPSLSLLSWFAPGPPESWVNSNTNDVDLGSSGPLLLPNGLLFAIGKGGRGYLLNQSALPDNSNPGGGENFSAQVCHATQDAAYGGLAVSGSTIFVPCSDGLAAVSIDSSTTFHTLWYSSSGGASPIVAGGLVWTMQTFGGTNLYGLQPGTGTVAASFTLPATTDHFQTPAAGDGMLFVGDGNLVAAYAPTPPPPPPPPPPFMPTNVGPPSVTVTPDGSAQLVFWRGSANHLFEAWYTGGAWYGPADLTAAHFGGAAPLSSAPTATVTADGSTQLVFWQGAAAHLFEAWYALGSWHGPLDISGAYLGSAAPLASAPSVAVTPDGTQQLVYWRGPANHLFEAWYTGGRWNGPADLTAAFFGGAGPLSSAPSAIVTHDGSTQLVFWQGPGGHLVEAWYGGGRWNGPVDWTAGVFGGAAPLASAPSVTVTPDGTQQLVYWQGAAGHLDEAWWAGGRWNGPLDLTSAFFGGAGSLTSAPSAAVTADGSTQLVFWQGPGQTLWEAWYTGRWNGPHNFSAG